MPSSQFAVAALLILSLAVAQAPRPLPTLAESTRIHDTKAAAARTWPELLDALSKHEVVFLGETHVDDTTHQVELHVLEGLLARRSGQVVLSMEMFDRDVQGALDDYLAGRSDEATFLAKARPWGNYRTGYRPLVEAAKAARIPVVAANFPGSLRRAFAGGDGKRALEQLTPEQRALVPAEIFPASAAYWERVDRAVRGHMGGPGGGTPEERRYETQNLWDNAMGDNIARARVAHPEALVLHVAGGFHVAYREGTVAQFVRRSPGSSFAVVSIAPTSELHAARPDRDREQADFLVYARTLSRELNDGNWAVEVPAELRYRLALPEAGTDLPLLVWLPDGATRTEDALARWQAAVGDTTAIVVVEAPFPEVQEDLAVAGRYVFGDGFRADYGRMSHGLARIVEYVTRKFPVDAGKVVVAGQGDGGAVVLWSALYSDWLAADFVAFDPTDLVRLGMEALPDQAPVAKSLHVGARDPQDSRLTKLVADHAKVGLTVTLGASAPADLQVEAVGLRLGRKPRADGPATLRLQLAIDTPRARDWQELYRLTLQGAGTIAGIVDAGAAVPAGDPALPLRRLEVGGEGPWPVASFADGTGIPLAGGPFGGTTIVVLPKGVSDSDRDAWLLHEQNRVLKRRSMFANIAVACVDREPRLPAVITQLRQKGRSRLLIVPAMFCADAATMRALQAEVGAAAAGMDVAWLPGLGAELGKPALPHGRR